MDREESCFLGRAIPGGIILSDDGKMKLKAGRSSEALAGRNPASLGARPRGHCLWSDEVGFG